MRFRRRVALATPDGSPDRQPRLVSSRLASQGPGMALGRGAELGVLCEARARPLAARCRTGNSASVATADGPRQPAPVRGARQIPQDPQLLPT